MNKEEQINILTALDVAIKKCQEQAELADTPEEKQYQWGQADGLQSASIFIAKRQTI